jgi:hypothetical protein
MSLGMPESDLITDAEFARLLAEGVWPFDAIPPGAARTKAGEYSGMPDQVEHAT